MQCGDSGSYGERIVLFGNVERIVVGVRREKDVEGKFYNKRGEEGSGAVKGGWS